MANATVSELIAAVQAIVPKLASNQARKLIKDNNIRSLSKANEVAANYKGKTKDELAATFGDAEPDEAKPAAAAKKVGRKGTGTRRTAQVVVEGARGFRFGDVWNASVIEGSGVAYNPANINKLHKHAESLSINFDKTDTAEAIGKKIAKKLQAA